MGYRKRDAPLAALHSSYQRLAEYSDLVIKCGTEEFKVHKLIVCSQSSTIEKEVLLKEKDLQPAIINVEKYDPAIVKLLIQFLYEGEYNPIRPVVELNLEDGDRRLEGIRQELRSVSVNWTYDFPHSCRDTHLGKNSDRIRLGIDNDPTKVCPHHKCVNPGSRNQNLFVCNVCKYRGELRKAFFISVAPEHLLLHAKMYAIAHDYWVHDLKEMALDKFKASCEKFWNHDIFLEVADYTITQARDCCPTLREIVASTIKAHPELVAKPAIRARIQRLDLTAWVLEEIEKRRRSLADQLPTTRRLRSSTTHPGASPLPPTSE